MSLGTEFASDFWRKLKEYLEKHAVLGHKLDVAEPNSIKLPGNKIPDIVIVDDKGIPVLIIEAKREAEGKSEERLLDPFTLAQAVCYATLASLVGEISENSLSLLLEHISDRTPMFATADRNTIILFKGVERDDLNKIIDINECIKPKRSPEDWAKVLKQPDGLKTLLDKYIIDRIENPLNDESIKKLFEHIGNWVSNTTTLKVDLNEILSKILEAAREVEVTKGTEEDLKMRVERILEESVWSKLKVPKPKYEKAVNVSTYYGRIDALYGLTIFEYKKPGTLKTKERDEAIKKLKEVYIPGLLEEQQAKNLITEAKKKGLSPRIIGIIFDGYGVIFVEYLVESGKFLVDPEVGFYDLSSENGVDYLRRIIRSVIATYKKKIDARALASDFGYQSNIAIRAIGKLYSKLINPKSEKTRKLFDEWRKTVSQAYPIFGEELRKIADLYRLSGNVDGEKLFYAIQTYYSLILKLIAAEVAARFHDSAAELYIKKLMDVKDKPDDFRSELESLESGMVYADYGIMNFLEGDFFSWYLNEWDNDIFSIVRDIVEKLSEYDIEALTLNLSTARDMFKLLYEELVPRKEVRQKLGIYTTPDWLAELILDELGLRTDSFIEMTKRGEDPLDLRVLDPAVGTGTFISLLIQRFGEYLRRYYGSMTPEKANEALKKITRNIVGFDIDTLAVLTARTNYLIALAVTGLLQHKGGEKIEIPIYMANSVITAEELRDKVMVNIEGKMELLEVIKIPTAVGDFYIPARLVKDGQIFELLANLREAIKNEYKVEHKIVSEILRKYSNSEAERQIIKELYNKLLELKEKGIDDVWVPVIKSHIISALFRNSFDYVVGNPPWIAYRYIANPDYQAKVKSLIKDYYGLVMDEHLMTHMEIATLFFVKSIDIFLKDGGLIGFVMPRAIFSADQHDRFRRGNVSNVKYKLLKIIDCENVEPLFYVPACSVIARKGASVEYPVEAIVVKGKLPEDKHKVLPLHEVLANKYLEVDRGKKLYLNEVGGRSFLGYVKVEFGGRRSDYYNDFYQGATIVPQPCWFVDVVDTSHPEFIFAKTARRAEVRGKVKAEIGPLPVERQFVYGVLTSAEVLPFCHLPPNTAVLPIMPTTSGYMIITKEKAKQMGYSKLAKWLEEAEKIWERVRGGKKTNLYEWLNYQRKLSRQNPSTKYKVVYLTSGTYLAACILVDEEVRMDNLTLNRTIVGHTLYLYQTNNLDEAYYLTAVLNSQIIDDIVKPLQPKGEFGERHFTKKPLEFPIPKFDPNNPDHKCLAELGRKASEEACKILPELLAKFGYDKKLKEHGTLTPQEVGRLRQAIRDHLKDVLKEIDDLVVKLLVESVKADSKAQGIDKWLKPRDVQ